MASDFYTFKGTVGSYEVVVDFIETNQISADEACVRSINGEPSEGQHRLFGFPLDRSHAERLLRIEDEILDLIRKGQFNLEYTGGWCPSGYTWGPEKKNPAQSIIKSFRKRFGRQC